MQGPFDSGDVRPAIKHEIDSQTPIFISTMTFFTFPPSLVWERRITDIHLAEGAAFLWAESRASWGNVPCLAVKAKWCIFRVTEERTREGRTMWSVANLVINFWITAFLLQIFCYKYLWEIHYCKVHTFFSQFPLFYSLQRNRGSIYMFMHLYRKKVSRLLELFFELGYTVLSS